MGGPLRHRRGAGAETALGGPGARPDIRQRVPLRVPARARREHAASGAPAVSGVHAGLPAPRWQRASRSAYRRAGTSRGLRQRRGRVARGILRTAARSHSPAPARRCTTCNRAALRTRSSPVHAGTWLATAGGPTTSSSPRPPWRTTVTCHPPRGGTESSLPRWRISQGPQRRRALWLRRRCSYSGRSDRDSPGHWPETTWPAPGCEKFPAHLASVPARRDRVGVTRSVGSAIRTGNAGCWPSPGAASGPWCSPRRRPRRARRSRRAAALRRRRWRAGCAPR